MRILKPMIMKKTSKLITFLMMLSCISSNLIASPRDLSITGITLGMTKEEVLKSIPSGFDTQIDETPSYFSGVSIEGKDLSSTLITAIKRTPFISSVNDEDTYGIQIFNGKAIYVAHIQTFQQTNSQANSNAPLASNIAIAMKEKYGLEYKNDYTESKGFLYFNGDNVINKSPVKNNMDGSQDLTCKQARNNYSKQGPFNILFIDIPTYVREYIDNKNNLKPEWKQWHNCYVSFDKVLQSSLSHYDNGLTYIFSVELFDYAQLHNISSEIEVLAINRNKKEIDSAKERMPKL